MILGMVAGVASPHTRGWTHEPAAPGQEVGGFPAHAGMDPGGLSGDLAPSGLPRTRGDGPVSLPLPVELPEASPHTRGWTRRPGRHGEPHPGFPAHAGMDPDRAARQPDRPGLPRTRGDGPCSTSSLAPAVTASPHTRGWTLLRGLARYLRRGFPAHAGMDPAPGRRDRNASGLPRTRGDGPRWNRSVDVSTSASPHTRGWTLVTERHGRAGGGFPAHAGMDRGITSAPCAAPRASPHTRGWTPSTSACRSAPRGFPAHAGMDLGQRRPHSGGRRLPRTRGDGPWH